MSDPRPDARAHAPATARNREPILAVLERLLPAAEGPKRVLEIASGTGEHAAFFAARLPHLRWQPSDVDAAALESIGAWRESTGPLDNLAAPMRLDVTTAWPAGLAVDVVFSANMIHIAPWEACLSLFRGASEVVVPGGVLVLYGPFAEGGRHTAPSNEAFDASLRARDARWGVRDLDDVRRVAEAAGFVLEARHDMPANNLTLVFRRV